jgi:uncharacterized membrane protein
MKELLNWVILGLVMLVLGSSVAMASTSVTVYVYGPSNTAVPNAVVQAYQSNSMVAQGTTGSNGAVTLTLPSNTTTTFWVSLGSGSYILETFSTLTSTITLNASSYYTAKLATNTTYAVPITITDSGNSITVYTNATVYSTDAGVTITYPNTTTVYLFTVLKLVNLTVNGSPVTGNSAIVTFNAPMTIIGYYTVSSYTFMGIPINTTTLIIVLAVVAVLLAVLVVYTKKERQKKLTKTTTPTWV